MGKHTHQPLFQITIETCGGTEMKFWVKRGYQIGNVGRRLYQKMLKLEVISRDCECGYALSCDDVRMEWHKRWKDYNIRDGLEVLPRIVVWVHPRIPYGWVDPRGGHRGGPGVAGR